MNKRIWGMLLALSACGPAWAEDCGSGRVMSFEAFMHREFPVDLPLRTYVPSEYEYVEPASKRAVTAHWMVPGQEKMLDMEPMGVVKDGFLFGIWSRNVTYDSRANAFVGLEDAIAEAQKDKSAGIEIERADYQGHDLLFVDFDDPETKRRAYTAYIDMNYEDSVFMVLYVPPESGDRAHSACVWRKVKSAFKGE